MVQSGDSNPFPVRSFLFNPIGRLKKEIVVSGLTLTNNEIKDIAKAIRSSENREILLKGTTTKIISQDG